MIDRGLSGLYISHEHSHSPPYQTYHAYLCHQPAKYLPYKPLRTPSPPLPLSLSVYPICGGSHGMYTRGIDWWPVCHKHPYITADISLRLVTYGMSEVGSSIGNPRGMAGYRPVPLSLLPWYMEVVYMYMTMNIGLHCGRLLHGQSYSSHLVNCGL